MPSILETFYILFESNSKDVKKGAEEAETSTKDLDASLVAADATASALGDHLVEKFVEVAGAIAAAFTVERITGFITETADLNAELGITAKRLGISVEDLDAWGQATQRAGGTTEGFTQTLDFLNRGMADIATKGTSRLKPFFDELKIKVTDAPKHVRPLLDILKELGEKTASMSAQQRAGIFEKLGIDPGTGLLIANTREKLNELLEKQKQIGVATEEDAERAHAYKQSLEDLEQQVRYAGTAIGSTLLPALESFFRAVGNVISYLGAHKGLVEGFFIGVAGVIATVYLPAAIEAAAATWAFLAPILAVVAPIIAVGVAIALLVDDVQNFLAGNQSVIGELSKSWPAVGETVREVVKDLGEAFEWFFDLFANGWKLAVAVVGLAVAGTVALFDRMGEGFHKMVEQFRTAFPLFAAGFEGLGKIIEWFAGLLGKVIGLFASLAAAAVKALPGALGHWATDANKLTEVAKGKKTYAQLEAEDRKALMDRLDGHGGRQPTVLRPSTAPGGPQPGHHLPPASEVAHMVVKAQASLKTADTTPLSSVSNSAITNSQRQGDRHYHVEVGPTTIQVPDADPHKIADGFALHLGDQLRQAIGHFDDGVAS